MPQNLRFRRNKEDLRDRSSSYGWYHILPVICIASFFFYLQARYLHLAAFPFTDEGVYAEAGRLMLEGLAPHKDFPLWHLPLLPLYSGIVLKLTGNMYWVRLLFLALNCFAVVPFYLTCKKLRDNSSAAILAILFYLTFHELMFQDFRFLAIRQMANNFLIVFFYLGVCQKQWKWKPIVQALLFGLSVLLFLPNLLNFSFLALAMSYSEESRVQRSRELKKYFLLGVLAIFILFIYFVFFPRSLDQIVFGQINREATGRFERLFVLLQAKKDIYLYLLGCGGLIYTAIWQRKLRFYALAFLGLVVTSTFLSSNFFPHYMSGAAPAFAFGIFGLGIGIYQFCQRLPLSAIAANFISLIIYILLFSYQFSNTFPSLYEQWTNNRNPSYYQTVVALTKTPEPLLTMEPIFAVEAGKQLVRTPIEIYFRAPGIDFPNPDVANKFSQQDFQAMATEACTIFLEGKGEQVFPIELQKRWRAEFQTFQKTRWGTILVTNNFGCH
ncbi:hypothetical protein C7B79_15365 [Chroococcidiopsis cubana CCALA 043]|uniref:hypothetical protein n=1 Tax=Chroococcidiopsis cubana TaxID=171392 RepID=UPI000D06969B|nr:hypothetical protein [Chroococcidiopsis cubana]PSB63084.1 hypothetical protein C7B79_15365 [Chroococcidiopsis cubana CCALA 043]